MDILDSLGINITAVAWHAFNFLLLLFVLQRFMYKPIIRMLDERSTRIRDSLAQAEAVRAETARLESESRSILEEARRDGQQILAQANRTAEQIMTEARNQARVHLWYGEKHGLPYPPLKSSAEGIDRFLTRNTRVGIRRTRKGYDVYAPDGFDDVAGMIVRPNRGPNFSAANYAKKAERWKALWPEITVLAGDAS